MYDAFYPGQVWLDTNGNRIQAHGGSLIYLDGVYYWYGENKEKTDKAAGIWHWGVRYYASTDLYNWEDRGLLIPPVTDDPNSSLHPTSMMDRPHIIYNARTKKYVCWLKIMEKDQTQTETVLTADSFFGPYTIVREKLRPLGMSAGDFDLAVAPDGKAYYFFERVHSETIIADLTEDYTDVTGYYSTHFPHKGPPHVREATAHFIRHGKHYLLTSGTTGYFPNPSEAAMADTWHGPYTVQGDPHIGDKTKTSFHSQISSVFKVPNKKDLYIACADRWMPNAPDYDYTHYGPLYDRLFDPDVEKTPADWALLANLPQEDVHYPDGTTLGARPGDEQQFDPGVLTEGETTWLYSGFCPPMMPGRTGALCYRLASDMLTVEQTYPAVVPGAQTAKGTGFEGHAFFEASSIRKVGDKYYFIYSSELSHELCYAVSDSPCRGFVYGGTLVDNADLGLCDTARYFTGNNHGSIEQINGRWYVFYHRHTNSSMFCRQGMVEPIEILPDGRIPQVEITTSGPSGAPLPAVELRELPAYAACNLYMTQPPQVNAEAGQNPFPYITQDGADVMPESESKPEAYICNLTPGTVVGFKYLNFQNVTKVSVKTRGMCYYGGFDVLLTADGEPIGTVSAARGNEWTWQTTELAIPDGISAIYFRMKGYGTLSLAAAKFH